MHQPILKILVIVLAMGYALAGASSIMEVRRQEEFQTGWALLAVFWLSLAVAIWRLGRISRVVSLTILWLLVLSLSVMALQPLYLPEISPPWSTQWFQHRPGLFLGGALFSLAAILVLGKYKQEFR